MPKAGAVSGMTSAVPAGTPVTGTPVTGTPVTGTPGGTAKAAVPPADTEAASPKPIVPPLAETSRRAPPEAPVQAATTLAATLAGLKPGQELRGTVRLLPGQAQALLTTPEGDFLIGPAAALETDGPVSLVLIRADRSISALLLSEQHAALDLPRPVRLTLISLHGTPPPAGAADGEARPAPAAPATAWPDAAAGPGVAGPSLTSLLPGEAIFLRGSAQPSPQNTTAPQPIPAPPAAVATAPAARLPAATTGHGVAVGAPRSLLHAPMLPDAPQPGPEADIPARPVPAVSGGTSDADPLAALFDRGVMPLMLRTDSPSTPPRMLTASLLATAAPGETSPLTHPPVSSPLARLAETGRIISATVLPPQTEVTALTGKPQFLPATAQPPAGTAPTAGIAPAPGSAATAAPQNQPVQLSVNGTRARIELPAGSPSPAPTSQLVFLVTRGHEALRAVFTAPLQTQGQEPGLRQEQGQAALPSGVAARSAAAPLQPTFMQPAPVRLTPDSSASRAETRAVATPPAYQAPDPNRAVERNAVPVPVGQSAPASTASQSEVADMLLVPGLPVPASITPASLMPAAPAAVSGAEALLLVVMQALGRKGFTAQPHNISSLAADAEAAGADTASGAPALARLLQTAAVLPAAPAPQAEQARDTVPRADMPDALPFAMTMQTPQGQVPLVFLVWQPLRADEDNGKGDASGEGEADVCFAVEVEFASIGRLRLRGAVRRTHLDLGIDSEQPLGAALQHAASRDFMQAVEAGGMTGTLVFRHQASG